MRSRNYGDVPNIPKELRKKEYIDDPLYADTPKRTWKTRKVRHKVKSLLRDILIDKNKK